ncbi:MAG: hypothetical protein HY869_20095 [Chloroflexi bacterium]|nr:hypothetical protein [Chloroflexota bacterium]
MIDLSSLMQRTWKITWKHKILWGAGSLMIFIVFLFLPLIFAPFFLLFDPYGMARGIDDIWPLLLMAGGFLALIVVGYGVNSLMRPVMVLGVLKAERGAEKLSLQELLREGTLFFWRFLGLVLLLALAITVVNFGLMGIQIVASIFTLGLANLCLWPLSFLIYPLMYAAMAVMELAEASMVVDGLGVMEALRRAWDIVLKNKMSVFLVALILYVGLSIISSFIFVPVFMPMGFMPMLIAEDILPRNSLWILGLGYLVALPIIAFAQGIILALTKTGWTLTYLRLSLVPPTENNTPILADEPPQV